MSLNRAIKLVPKNVLDIRNTGEVLATGMQWIASYVFFNKAATTRYVKIYDTAVAPTSSDTPILTVTVFAGQPAGISLPGPIIFTQGVGVRATTGIADNDTGDPSANDVSGNVFCEIYRSL